MASTLFRELSWLAAALLTALIAGAVIGAPGWTLVAALVAYAASWIVRVHAIVRWLNSGGKASKAPATIGLMSDVVALVHREKRYSRKQKHRFRAALAQFHGLASELPDATLVLDSNRAIRWANPASRSLLGVSAGRDRGNRIDNLVRDPGFGRFIREPDSLAEFEMAAPTDPAKVLAVRIVPAARGLSVLIARDVTQRVRVREMRKAFVGNVSHELRTPLTVIQGYLEVLRDDDTLAAGQRGALEQISGQADRMQHIVEHLLELSKLEGNPLGEQEGEPVRVAPLVRALLQALETSIEPGQRLEHELDDHLLLLGSESDLYSAVQNLVTNALKYGGSAVGVTVRWALDDAGMPTLSVIDDGAGIAARHVPRLSERFYRVDAGRSRRSGGTGLGLAIVKHVAQRHGGTLHIASMPGEGSTFSLHFPASRALDDPDAMALRQRA